VVLVQPVYGMHNHMEPVQLKFIYIEHVQKCLTTDQERPVWLAVDPHYPERCGHLFIVVETNGKLQFPKELCRPQSGLTKRRLRCVFRGGA
jgi:hypothetical protein